MDASFEFSPALRMACATDAERQDWLKALPAALTRLVSAWGLRLEENLAHEGQGSWVWTVRTLAGAPAVLKFGMPHFEALDEIAGLRFWAGEPCVELLAADAEANALLLERCLPGDSLRRWPETDQDRVIAALLRRLWRRPEQTRVFRPLAAMLAYWSECTYADEARWSDKGLVKEGLALFAELARPCIEDVLLATDLHAGNVLASEREPWLVIDPKPFVGDRAYDATQHFFNCRARLLAAPADTICHMARLLELEPEALRLWLFARAAAEPRADWSPAAMNLARRLARLRC